MQRRDVSAPFARAADRLTTFAKETPRVIGRATSTLARRLPVEARKDIQDEYNVAAAPLRTGLTASQGDGYVQLTGSKRGIGLIQFGGTWGGRKTDGAYARVLNSGGGGTLGGAFIATGNNGNRQIFDRKIINGKRAPRLPMQALYGPSVAQMLRKGERVDRLAGIAQSVLALEINRLLGT